MSKCNHDISVLETTEAGTRHWIEEGKLVHNIEPGMIVRKEVECHKCGKKWNITRTRKHLPKGLLFQVYRILNQVDLGL